MYVVAASLEPGDLAVLDGVCAELGLALHVTDPVTAQPDWPDVLLAVLQRFPSTEYELTPTEIKRRGGYPIGVLPAVSATGVLAAVSEGFAFTLATPLRHDRVVGSLGYLKSVAPPTAAQILDIDDDAGTLSSPSKSTAVTPAEANLLRCLSDRPSQIVSREVLGEATGGEDVNKVVSVLKQKLMDIDSGAKILKVPHLGFRLVGSVRADADVVS